MKKIAIAAWLVFILSPVVFTQIVEVRNDQLRKDINGNIIDAHDGRVIRFNNTYYWYGTSYGNTNGMVTDNVFHCYSSADLIHWKDEGVLLPNQPKGVYYRPHVIYNKKTKQYVLWYNWYEKLWVGQYGVAVSAKPEGPYKIVNKDVKLKYSDLKVGDLYLFADEDGSAYISYNTIEHHYISVEKLSADYLSSTMENSGFITDNSEASSMFKRQGKYYLLTDRCCCFCSEGTGAQVYISDNPLKGYKFSGNINRVPGKKMLLLNDNIIAPDNYEEFGMKSSIIFKTAQPCTITDVIITARLGNIKTWCGSDVPEDIYPHFELSCVVDDQPKKQLASDSSVVNKAVTAVVAYKVHTTAAREFQLAPVKSLAKNIQVSEIEFYQDGHKVEGEFYLDSANVNNVVIPAQQTCITELQTSQGTVYIWMGDMWGSTPDRIKGHDYQFWSAPLQFNSDGSIMPLKWTDAWSVELIK